MRYAAQRLGLIAIFVALPIVLYSQFESADSQMRELVTRAVQDRSALIAEALTPVLRETDPSEPMNLNRALDLAGHLSETIGTLTVGNQSQGVFALGAETDEYGTAWADYAQRPVQVIGVDAAEYVKPWVDRGARPGQVVGFNATTYGVPELYNSLQFVLAAGAGSITATAHRLAAALRG